VWATIPGKPLGSRKIRIGALIAALATLAFIGFLSFQTMESLVATARTRDHYDRVREKLGQLLTQLDDAETGQRGYLITGQRPYLEPYESAKSAIHQTVKSLDALIYIPAEPLIEAKLSELEETIHLRQTSGFAAARQVVLSDRGKRAMDEIRQVIGEMQAREDVLLLQTKQEAETGARRTLFVLVAGNVLSFALLVLVFLLLNRENAARQRAEDAMRGLNQALERRTVELEATNKELEAFTYSVSHDLRAPLRHVDGFSKLLLEESSGQLSEDSKRYLGFVRDGVIQMGQLVDDLLGLARVGRKELSVQVTGLNSLVDEVVTELGRDNSGRVIDWKVQQLPFVECDPALMKQVFVNLLSNALKYSRPRQRAVIEVGISQQNGERAVFVRDNGVGFNMKYADKLFGVFQRLHRPEDFEGTGVGLATVQRIIQKHGGRVWAEAALDQGATFYFTVGKTEGRQSKV
jgi:signal transduction histidine kinase